MRSTRSNPGIQLLAAAAVAGTSAAASAQPDPSGIDFVTIGAVNNAPWPGNGTPSDPSLGRGSVGYEYRIGRFEVTTSQWAEFMNSAFDRPRSDWLPHLSVPGFWGASAATPTVPGGMRWEVPVGNEMRAVGGISWRAAAMYCNWLHNDRRNDTSAFMNGAYEVSTFGYTGSVFTDQHVRNPEARYWIPNWDEWLKATHYDPNKYGIGQEGWWLYSTSSDEVPAYGPPGAFSRMDGGSPVPDPRGRVSEANGGWDAASFGGVNPFTIPLGAYQGVTSPWGLFDAAGATSEWTEGVLFTNGVFPTDRFYGGSHWTSSGGGPAFADTPFFTGGAFPSFSAGYLGVRIAAAVPGPASPIVPLAAIVLLSARRRRDRCARNNSVRIAPDDAPRTPSGSQSRP